MKTVLLILILFGDQGEPLAKGVADDLARVGGENAQVLVGAAAVAELEKRGVKIQDIIGSPNIGDHLTESDPNIAVVHLDRQVAGGDVVVETRLWLEGKNDRHVAIAGNGGDPQASVSNGLVRALAHRLPNARPTSPAADETQLAALAERKEWQQILGLLAGVEQRSPRQWYYQVLAFSRLGRRDAAVDALNAMRAAHPDHFLIKAAEDVVPPAADDAGKDLKDVKDQDAEAPPAAKPLPVPAGDDGGNTLR